MIGKAPVCMECKHFRKGRGLSCSAFPKRIPDEILIGGNDHSKPVSGDHGIRFESKGQK